MVGAFVAATEIPRVELSRVFSVCQAAASLNDGMRKNGGYGVHLQSAHVLPAFTSTFSGTVKLVGTTSIVFLRSAWVAAAADFQLAGTCLAHGHRGPQPCAQADRHDALKGI